MQINRTIFASLLVIAAATGAPAQTTGEDNHGGHSNAVDIRSSEPVTQKVVVVTGARFSYKLVEKWIEDYNKINPNVQIIVEARGSADPQKYDILAEVYRHDDSFRKNRRYVNVGRYAILPVATTGSSFANTYSQKGLNTDAIRHIFFHTIFTDGKQKKIEEPFTAYTRLQKAGVPLVFASYFGHDQKDIRGTAIAGADSHLLKALLRDSSGVTYLPLPLIYDEDSRKPIEGLTVLPVDLNGNKKVNDDEKFYGDLDRVIERLEGLDARDISNIPLEYLHLSIDENTAGPEAIEFLKWVHQNGQRDLHHFGYLKPGSTKADEERFQEFTSQRNK